MQNQQIGLRCVLDARAGLAESPVWSGQEQVLYWADIGAWHDPDPRLPPPSLNRFDPATGANQRWVLPEPIGCFALCAGNRAIVALVSGIHEFDFATEALTCLARSSCDPNNYRFNDGKCDPAGRLWVGQVARRGQVPPQSCELFRYDGRSFKAMGFRHSVSNGMAWSPDGRIMYFADTIQRTTWAFDYDSEHGRFSNQRVFVTVPEGVVLDGATVDAEGGYWVALYNAGKVARYLPDGRLDLEIVLPVSKPTMVAFGGADLATLFVTSASHALSEAERAMQAQAGGIFCCEPGVRGLPEPRFVSRA